MTTEYASEISIREYGNTIEKKRHHMTEAGDPIRSTAPAWNHCTANVDYIRRRYFSA